MPGECVSVQIVLIDLEILQPLKDDAITCVTVMDCMPPGKSENSALDIVQLGRCYAMVVLVMATGTVNRELVEQAIHAVIASNEAGDQGLKSLLDNTAKSCLFDEVIVALKLCIMDTFDGIAAALGDN